MAFRIADRVHEITETTGTGPYGLLGAPDTSRVTFAQGIGNGNTTYYVCTDGTEYEVGVGTVTGGTPTTLSRDTILASSNAGLAVNWGTGQKDIFVTVAAARFPHVDDNNTVVLPPGAQLPVAHIPNGGIGTSKLTDNGVTLAKLAHGTAHKVIGFNASGVPAEVDGVPAGLIAMWSGNISSIPVGWALCNGANGTPDLRNRFIVAAGGAYAVGATGGSDVVATTSGGSHHHGMVTHYHTLTTNQIPAHSHNTHVISGDIFDGGPYSYVARYTSSPNGLSTSTVGASGSHNHGISTDGVHQHTVDTRSPYYALAFIMKIN